MKSNGLVKSWYYFIAAALFVLTFWYAFLRTITDSTFTFDSTKGLQYSMLVSKIISKDTLADLNNFQFVMNNSSLCTQTDEKHSNFVIMVHSARYNFDHRYAIRSTWGSVKMFRQWRFHLIFLLGIDPQSDPESYPEKRLWYEQKEFGDMIMGNFVDSYHNLTYKHLMGYKWVETYCPTAEYILKSDDDMFTDIFQVIDELLQEFVNSKKTFACENMDGNTPVRQNNSKWYVSESEFPDTKYPAFCSGSAYIVRANDAAKIYSISDKINFFWIDDVFVTGILRERYDEIARTGRNNSLEISSVRNRHHLGDKKEIISWCSADSTKEQLKYPFVLLNKEEFVSDMICIWSKVKLMRCAMDDVSDILRIK